ncbi:class I SAM-dependent methyltransferase [Bacillus sp. RAR_GA_16]|uniref:class I SAM-dependent methyltransferase n=1 Tax=Bacillus sp. RAR_GA_16 TaxID=2876774 RepID=UPI001CCC47F8|nr:class I SAM-dependent methyltransferase [Bacillus sp. RAR_GA_16]MCA0170947.1 class I SAM-dependent methyltransferase [Bacillus sp. RAR_GA_16]
MYKDLFKGAAPYYSKYRPSYPEEVIEYLTSTFQLNGTGTLLDVGCGPGQMAIRLSEKFENVIGVDIEKEMIEEARRLADPLPNITWHHCDVDSFLLTVSCPIKLVTLAKSFHWLDRKSFLEKIYPYIEEDGGIGIIDDFNVAQPLEEWQMAFREVVTKWYGERRRAGNSTYTHPSQSHKKVLQDSQFYTQSFECSPVTYRWTPESIIGHHYSLSYGLKHFLKGSVEDFEADVKQELARINPDGEFFEHRSTRIEIGRKRRIS